MKTNFNYGFEQKKSLPCYHVGRRAERVGEMSNSRLDPIALNYGLALYMNIIIVCPGFSAAPGRCSHETKARYTAKDPSLFVLLNIRRHFLMVKVVWQWKSLSWDVEWSLLLAAECAAEVLQLSPELSRKIFQPLKRGLSGTINSHICVKIIFSS